LSIGKLTACVEKKAASGQKSNSALFAVRTATAIVTDLGTEFGVEVKDNGETRSHVFCGSVQLQQTGVAMGKETSGNTVILHANEAASVKIQNSGKHNKNKQSGITTNAKETELALSRTEFDVTAFVLPNQMGQYAEEQRLKPFRRWQTYSRELRKDPALVAYYDFQMKDGNCSVLPNLSSAGSSLDGHVVGGDWVDGRLFGKMGLYFRGPSSGCHVVLPNPDRFEFPGAFSVAVWFKIRSVPEIMWTALVTKGQFSWRLQYQNISKHLFFDDTVADHFQITMGQSRIAEDQWHLAVVIYEPQGNIARKQIYVDGQLDVENTVAMSRMKIKCPVWIGGNRDSESGYDFSGWLDEVAMFSRALSTEEVMAMFQAGNPQNN
jgi:hypothetical protein